MVDAGCTACGEGIGDTALGYGPAFPAIVCACAPGAHLAWSGVSGADGGSGGADGVSEPRLASRGVSSYMFVLVGCQACSAFLVYVTGISRVEVYAALELVLMSVCSIFLMGIFAGTLF